MGANERGNWDNKLEYLLSSIGYAVGLGNVWRFPYLCYKNGGGAFLLPYLIVLALCGLPIFLLESSLGQFSSQGPVRAFNGMPMFKGLGFAMLAVSSFVAPYYNIILSWAIFYLYQGFRALFTGNVLPWKYCDTTTNSTCYNRETASACLAQAKDTIIMGGSKQLPANFTEVCPNFENRQTSVEIYYDAMLGVTRPPFRADLPMFDKDKDEYVWRPSYKIAHNITGAPTQSDIDAIPEVNLDSLDGIQWHLVLTLGLSWLFIALSILKGVKSSGKTMYFTATFPYLVLTILLVRGVQLDGAIEGIKFFIKPVPKMLLNPVVWKDAATQIFYSLSVSWGGLLTLSSYNPFRNNVYRDTYIVVCANSATSVYAGFAIFSYLGYMAHELSMPIEKIVAGGPGLAFMVWPEAMAKLSEANWVCAIFSVIFFAMLYSLGISTMIVTVETICTSFLDIFPGFRKRRPMIVFALIAVLYLVGIPMVTGNGVFWFTVFDDYSASYSLLVSAILEMLAAHWFYGIDRMSNDVKMMTGKHIPQYFRTMWGYITPSVLVVTLAFNVIKHASPTETAFGVKYPYPGQTKILAVILVFTPILLMVGLAIRELKRWNWSVSDAVRPTNHWGPHLDSDREQFNGEREDALRYATHKSLKGAEEERALKSGAQLLAAGQSDLA